MEGAVHESKCLAPLLDPTPTIPQNTRAIGSRTSAPPRQKRTDDLPVPSPFSRHLAPDAYSYFSDRSTRLGRAFAAVLEGFESATRKTRAASTPPGLQSASLTAWARA